MPDNLTPKDRSNPYADYTVQQMYDFLGRVQLTRDIGSQYEYSNLGVGLLGHVLALRAGKPYEALLRERVLDPLGMRHTGITLTPWMRDHLARGHDASGQVVSNWDIPTLAGAGAMRSTVNDMLRFARANLDPAGGRLQQVIRRTHESRAPTNRPELTVGLNWHIRRVADRDIVWHNGGTGGYRTWFGFDKARRIAAVVLTNSGRSNDDLGYELLK
jgi:CubicO group peptidase (beta-lactamase class C family)